MGSAAGAPPGGSKGSKGAPAWPELQQVAAHLYTVQGRHEEALELQLQVGEVGACHLLVMQARVPGRHEEALELQLQVG